MLSEYSLNLQEPHFTDLYRRGHLCAAGRGRGDEPGGTCGAEDGSGGGVCAEHEPPAGCS
jgi:hypothetical protein